MVDLLQELTDVDSLQENEEGADILLDALVRTPIKVMSKVTHRLSFRD